MADKKITQFEKFPGEPDSHTYFVLASGENEDPDARNYRLDFLDLSTKVIGSAFGGSIPWENKDLSLGIGISDPEDGRKLDFNVMGNTMMSLDPIAGVQINDKLTIDGDIISLSDISAESFTSDQFNGKIIDCEGIWARDSITLANGLSQTPLKNSDDQSFRLAINTALNGSQGGIFIDSKTRDGSESATPLLQIDAGIASSNSTCLTVNGQGQTSLGHFETNVGVSILGAPSNIGTNNEILKLCSYLNPTNNYLGAGIDVNNDRAWIRSYNDLSESDLVLQNEGGAGNVGIGKLVPTAKLHVGGGSILDGDLAVGGSSTLDGNLSVKTNLAAQWTDTSAIFDGGIEVNSDGDTLIDITSTNSAKGSTWRLMNAVSNTNQGQFMILNSSNGGGFTEFLSIGRDGNIVVIDDIEDSNGVKFAKTSDIPGATAVATTTSAGTVKINPDGGLSVDSDGALSIAGYDSNYSDGALFTSDEKLKSNITKIESPISIAKSIEGVRFEWNEKSEYTLRGKEDIGLIAQNVKKVLPEAVSSNSNSELSVYYHKLVPVLLECIKDQQDQIDSLGKRISDLEK